MSRHSTEDNAAGLGQPRTNVLYEEISGRDRSFDEQSTDAYLRVLSELQRKRREIDAAISAIRHMLSESAVDVRPSPEMVSLAADLNITDAIESILRQLRRPARNFEIKTALVDHGYQLSGNPDVSIHQALHRLLARNSAAKVGRGLWVHRDFS